ncbi:hypothetical protein JW777_10725 [bacterium]|nr:hypothetical protein [bacterium]
MEDERKNGTAVVTGSCWTGGADGDDRATSYGRYSTASGYAAWNTDYRAVLEPLLETLRSYDALRLTLERSGGTGRLMTDIREALTREFTIRSSYGDHAVRLTDPEGLHSGIRDACNYRVHLDVRLTPHDMPAYYLCRIHEDFWEEYSLIVEDLYVSPGYPMIDERFIRLMSAGHEKYFLRLSQFRKSAGKALSRDGFAASGREVDDYVLDAGKYVFQAAWHDDQRPGILTAKHLDLPLFHRAVELLYLCLNGDLCELRSVTHGPMVHFFEAVYPQPAIRDFMLKVKDMDGFVLNKLPQKALNLYIRLSGAFSRFMKTEVTWGNYGSKAPLYKIIFGNFGRLEKVGAILAGDPAVRTAAGPLENVSEGVVREIIEMK